MKKKKFKEFREYKPSLKKIQKKLRDLERKARKFWKPKEGKNVIRILPPWSDAETFYKEVPYHWNVTSDKKGFTCRSVIGKKCYICEVIQELSESSSPADQKRAQDLMATTRMLYNIVDMDNQSAGIQLYASGEKILQELLSHYVDTEWGNFTHYRKGYDVIIHREGTGLSTKYTLRLKRNPSPIADKRWLKELVDLDTVFPIPTYKEQKAAYLGDLEEEEED